MTFMLLTIFFNGGIFQSVISSNNGTVFINANYLAPCKPKDILKNDARFLPCFLFFSLFL